jgi:hypothetical protein
VWHEISVSKADVTVIPSQFKVTKQILIHGKPFRTLKNVGSRPAEQLMWPSQQRIVATVEESVLKSEMTDLESREEDDPSVSSCILLASSCLLHLLLSVSSTSSYQLTWISSSNQ